MDGRWGAPPVGENSMAGEARPRGRRRRGRIEVGPGDAGVFMIGRTNLLRVGQAGEVDAEILRLSVQGLQGGQVDRW